MKFNQYDIFFNFKATEEVDRRKIVRVMLPCVYSGKFAAYLRFFLSIRLNSSWKENFHTFYPRIPIFFSSINDEKISDTR